MPNWPATGLDALPRPTANTNRDDPGYQLHSIIGDLSTLAERNEARWGTDAGATTPIADSQVEGTGTGTSAWRKNSRARAFKSAAVQSLANNTLAAITLDAEVYDNDAIHDNATNNSRLTCKTAGVYSIVGQVNFDTNTVNVRVAFIYLNGSAIAAQYAVDPNGAGARVQVAAQYQLAVNDYIELYGYQLSGGALNVMNGTGLTWLAMARLG
jgi:hypothetical protein